MIDTSFFSWLDSQTTWQIQEGKIDTEKDDPFIWFRRASTVQFHLLNGTALDVFTTYFDVEVIGADIDAVQTQADSLKTALQSISPATVVGSTFCKAITVEDHEDDYLSKVVLNTDDGLHLASFSVKIIHRA